MSLLQIPDDVAIGGLDSQARELARRAERAADDAQLLALSLIRLDSSWRRPLVDLDDEEEARPWPRRISG